MHIHPRTLLVAALGVAILAPVAYAQSTHAQVHAAGQAAPQEPTPPLPPTLPPTANDVDAAPLQKPVRNDSDRVDTPMTPPVSAQGAAHAQAHSAVVQRDTWAKLDLDHDGRISASEADADTAVDTHFGDMDANDDGFISDAEYRAYAKDDAGTSQGATHAAGHSMVVTRDVFTRIDADADGRISASEAAVDADVNGMFAAMDSNNDGYVTDAEFRAHAKADMP
jgi:Ca2+-binding EF-hand superfamily protein